MIRNRANPKPSVSLCLCGNPSQKLNSLKKTFVRLLYANTNLPRKYIMPILLVLFFSLLFAVSADDFEYPTLINPDGTIQTREFTNEQRATFEIVKKDVKFFQGELSKFIPYLVRQGSIKNNSYTREIRNFTETQPGRRLQHFVIETFVLKMAEGKLDSISFHKRRTRLSSKMDSETVIKSISNEPSNEEMTGVKVQVDKHTNYTESNAPIRKMVSMSEIPSPVDRIRLLRTYRTKLEEAVRELDKLVDHKALNDRINLSNTLNDVELE